MSPSMQIQDKDQSGQASSTAKSEQGIKAKELKVSGLISFDEEEKLTRLYALAEAKGDGGGMARYRVANKVARAIKFREATFSGAVSADQQTDKMAWLINFTLKEVASVAEKRAAQAGEGKAGSGGKGGTVAQNGTGTSAAEETPEQLTWFENVLKKIDTAIGPGGGAK